LSVALLRVDDRLVHGQVLVAWGQALRPAGFLVIDDALAADELERMLLVSSGGESVVEVLDTAAGAERLLAEQARAEPLVVLLRGLREAVVLARALHERGGSLPPVNLGGLHYAPGRDRVHDYVYLDAADRAALAGLAGLGVRVTVQDVPATRPFDAPAEWSRGAGAGA
jgi:mannose/fructose/N-acetylgalactosamine-specific phosphotransferase system component IIB